MTTDKQDAARPPFRRHPRYYLFVKLAVLFIAGYVALRLTGYL